MGELSDAQARLIDRATEASVGPASLSDIAHVVILMQENRSFDHYFGTLSGVRGFSDPNAPGQSVGGREYPIFDQFGYQPGHGADPGGYLQPFRLTSDPPLRDGQTLNDISHTWATQHQSWNGGAMDKFVATHVAADGAEHGPVTMGYYTRAELPFYYALADAFTVCDGYFSSVLGPTDSNRLMAVSATIDPDGSGRRARAGDVRQPDRRVRQADLGNHAGTAAGGRGELEVLQRPAVRARAEPTALLQGL